MKSGDAAPNEMGSDDERAVRWFSVFNESERGVVVSGVALVDDTLMRLVIAGMSARDHHIPGPIHKFREGLFSPEGQGCFSSLHSKYQIAYAMGWITESIYKDIKVLAKIRNRAAHDFEHFTFISKDVIKLIRKLSHLDGYSEQDLLGQEAFGVSFGESDVSYSAGGSSAKAEFFSAVFSIVNILEEEIRSARIPPDGEMTLVKGDIVQINHGFLKGGHGIVRSVSESTGRVLVLPLGQLFRFMSEEQSVYYYDLELIGRTSAAEVCDFAVGDSVRLADDPSGEVFSGGEVVSISVEDKVLEVVSQGSFVVRYRGCWDEFIRWEVDP